MRVQEKKEFGEKRSEAAEKKVEKKKKNPTSVLID